MAPKASRASPWKSCASQNRSPAYEERRAMRIIYHEWPVVKTFGG